MSTQLLPGESTYAVYRKAIDAMKIELGYQEMRKTILSKNLSDDIFVLDTNFETKCRKQDREFFHTVWFPKVLQALQTHSVVVGTITSLPKKKDGEGHYMSIMFVKGKYKKDCFARLYDPSDGQRNSVCVYDTKLVKQHLESMLSYWKWPLREYKTRYSCQIRTRDDTDPKTSHIDTYCQTWSLLLLIYSWTVQRFEDVIPFGKDEPCALKARYDLFIKSIREYILPHMDKVMLEKTFQTQLAADNLHYDGSAYDILMGIKLPECSYLFFRDTPYEVDASGLNKSRA